MCMSQGQSLCENVGLCRLWGAPGRVLTLAWSVRADRHRVGSRAQSCRGRLQAWSLPRPPHPSLRLATQPSHQPASSSGLLGTLATQASSTCCHGNGCQEEEGEVAENQQSGPRRAEYSGILYQTERTFKIAAENPLISRSLSVNN